MTAPVVTNCTHHVGPNPCPICATDLRDAGVSPLAGSETTMSDDDLCRLGQAVEDTTADWVVVDELYRRAGLARHRKTRQP